MNSVSQHECWYLSRKLWAIMAIYTVLIVYPFMDTIIDMEYRWRTIGEYGYGYIIPLLTIFLVWQRKNSLMESEFKPTYWAIPVLLISGLLYFVGAVSTTHTLSQYALVLTILGLAYGFLGWVNFRIVAIPLALLFLMVPLPPFILINLSGQLQLISSELGVAVIRLFGISVFLEGNVIDLGVFQLQVAEACSGLRYLFPLVCLSFVAAYLYKVEIWKRILVFLTSIPITVLMNSFRIGVIGVLVEYYGIEQAEGFLHDFEGWFIFMACMGILFIEMAILARIGKHKKKLADVFTIELPDPVDKDCIKKEQPVQNVHYAMVIVLACYGMSTFYIDQREDIHLARKDFVSFPNELGEWKGKKDRLNQYELGSLKTDDYITADYVNNNGKIIDFYITFYASQQAGSAAHSPRACLPGNGWIINDLKTIEIPEITISGHPLSANRLLTNTGDNDQLFYYWFQQRGRVITNEYLVKWYLFWDALTKNRTDGALVRLMTPVSTGEDLNKADRRLVEFIKQVEPILPEYIPE